MILKLQKEIIYGPIRSRRLGNSLGINILPPDYKTCYYNCVYCHYGWTKSPTNINKSKKQYPSQWTIHTALKKPLISDVSPIDYITFSGNGEPTLHPDFPSIVEDVIYLRNKYLPHAKTAILSNSSSVTNRKIRESLEKLDVRIMKLDCGTNKIFKKYNKPNSNIILDEITLGLKELNDVTIQTLISVGKSGNFDYASINKWIERLIEIKPILIQLYTLSRGYPDKNISPASRIKLDEIRLLLQKNGLSARIY